MTNPQVNDAIEAMAVALHKGTLETGGGGFMVVGDSAEAAQAALAALEASGWAVVPVEASDAMIVAGIVERHDADVPEAWSLATANIYRAMLAARPRVEG